MHRVKKTANAFKICQEIAILCWGMKIHGFNFSTILLFLHRLSVERMLTQLTSL